MMPSMILIRNIIRHYLKRAELIQMVVQYQQHFMFPTNGQIMVKFRTYTPKVMKWLLILFRKWVESFDAELTINHAENNFFVHILLFFIFSPILFFIMLLSLIHIEPSLFVYNSGDLPVETLPQIVLITFDDSVNDLNKQLYSDLFEKGRVNPNGCPISATFYVSHEWTDYSQVQNLYSDGHEMASRTIS